MLHALCLTGDGLHATFLRTDCLHAPVTGGLHAMLLTLDFVLVALTDAVMNGSALSVRVWVEPSESKPSSLAVVRCTLVDGSAPTDGSAPITRV